MISNKSFEPGENHLPYRKALAGHDFGFGDVPEQENSLMESDKKVLHGNKKVKGCKTKKKCVGICPPSKVDHPSHYNTGRIEVIDAIESWDLAFNDGNAIKYIARHKYKGEPIQDIEKAIWYLERHLSNLKKQAQTKGDTNG